MKGLTDKQMEALQLVRRGAEAGSDDLIDFDQLIDALSWKPTKQSAQFTVRALIVKGLAEKKGTQLRRGRQRVVYRLTKSGREVFDPRPDPLSKPLPFIPELSEEANPEVFKDGEEVVLPG
jgi:DNA-binding PadR family transcriptional regulator